MATKHSRAPLQKHLLGGCIIGMPPSNCHWRGGHIILFSRHLGDTLLFLFNNTEMQVIAVTLGGTVMVAFD